MSNLQQERKQLVDLLSRLNKIALYKDLEKALAAQNFMQSQYIMSESGKEVIFYKNGILIHTFSTETLKNLHFYGEVCAVKKVESYQLNDLTELLIDKNIFSAKIKQQIKAQNISMPFQLNDEQLFYLDFIDYIFQLRTKLKNELQARFLRPDEQHLDDVSAHHLSATKLNELSAYAKKDLKHLLR